MHTRTVAKRQAATDARIPANDARLKLLMSIGPSAWYTEHIGSCYACDAKKPSVFCDPGYSLWRLSKARTSVDL